MIIAANDDVIEFVCFQKLYIAANLNQIIDWFYHEPWNIYPRDRWQHSTVTSFHQSFPLCDSHRPGYLPELPLNCNKEIFLKTDGIE